MSKSQYAVLSIRFGFPLRHFPNFVVNFTDRNIVFLCQPFAIVVFGGYSLLRVADNPYFHPGIAPGCRYGHDVSLQDFSFLHFRDTYTQGRRFLKNDVDQFIDFFRGCQHTEDHSRTVLLHDDGCKKNIFCPMSE